MKKIIIVLSFVLTILIGATALMEEDKDETVEYPHYTIKYQEEDIVYYDTVCSIDICLYHNPSKRGIQFYIDNLQNSIPNWLSDNNHISRIIITGGSYGLEDIVDGTDQLILGTTSIPKHLSTEIPNCEIFVCSDVLMEGTLAHELIHAWDILKMNEISQQPEFMEAFKKEASKFNSTIMSPEVLTTQPREFLAEAGASYLLKQHTIFSAIFGETNIKQDMPLTYSFLQKHFK